jgi:Transposase.
MPSDPQALIDYVQKHFPNYDVSLTYEAGCYGFSSAREYLNMGWQVSIVNPADVPTGHKQSFQKTDKIDSRNLCRQLKMGNLKSIYIPTEAQEQFRALVRHRISLAKDLRRAKRGIL